MSMSVPLSRVVALACAVLVLGAATTASARPKKHSAEKPRAERNARAPTNSYGPPITRQGTDAPRPPPGGEEPEPEQPTNRADRRRLTARGSAGSYAPARLSTPSLPLSQPSTGVYIPPPVSNP